MSSTPGGEPPTAAGPPGAQGPAGAPEPARSRPQLRASDADRLATVRVLQDAIARGLLTFEEAGERMAAAYAARFVDELPPLTADLPAAASPAPAGGWRSVGTLLAEQLRTELVLLQTHGLHSSRTRRTAAVALLLVVMLATITVLSLHGLTMGEHQFYGDFGPRGGFAGR